MYWKKRKKKIIYVHNFWMFPVVEIKKKTEKKERCRNWNGLGYCPTVLEYNEKLYCDTTGFGSAVWPGKKVMIQLDCIVTGAA